MEDLEQGSPVTRPPGELAAAEAPEDAGSADGAALDAQSAPARQPKPTKPPRTRTGAAFQAAVLGAVVLVLLLIFILENTESVKINFLGVKGHISLGVALLFAAAGGALVVSIIGLARISQLRLHERRQRRR